MTVMIVSVKDFKSISPCRLEQRKECCKSPSSVLVESGRRKLYNSSLVLKILEHAGVKFCLNEYDFRERSEEHAGLVGNRSNKHILVLFLTFLAAAAGDSVRVRS